MSQRSVYAILASVFAAALVYLIVYGPDIEEKKDEPHLWKKSWEKIEYRPAVTEEKPPGSEAAAPAAGQTATRTKPITVFRESGFFRDNFFVQGTALRRGGYNVTNLFSDWDKPKFQAVYEVPAEKLSSMGFSDKSAKILLYEDKDGEPVTVTVGTKLQSGNTYITASLPEYAGKVILVQSYFVEKFNPSELSFRETRILLYPAESYTDEMLFRIGAGETYQLFQSKVKKEEQDDFTWKDGDEKDVPVSMAAPLENFVKQIQIYRFRDDPETAALGDAQKLWDEAGKDELVIELNIKKGDRYTLHLRRPAKPIDINKNGVALVQSSMDTGTDFVEIRLLDNILRQIENIRKAKN